MVDVRIFKKDQGKIRAVAGKVTKSDTAEIFRGMNMRLSELSGKEIVNYKKAERLGVLGQTDLEIDENTGHINTLIIPNSKWFRVGRQTTAEIRVPWQYIRTIGTDMVILDVPED